MSNIDEDIVYTAQEQQLYDYICHYGMPRRSGRYPWGSGEDPYQHSQTFKGMVEKMRKSNFVYKDSNGKVYTGDNAIAKEFGLTTTEFRTEMTICEYEDRAYKVKQAKTMTEDGMTPTQIGKRMGINESSVRSLLNESSEKRMVKFKETYNKLKEAADKTGMLDVSTGVERELGVSKEKMDAAIYMLKREGYNVYAGGVPQVTNPKGQQTTQKILCKPGVEHKEIYDYNKIATLNDYHSDDNGETFRKFQYPQSIDSKRIAVRYAEDGGTLQDGVVELRRGVKDLSLGNDRYSQVRILVDGTHYIKGMAVYSDDLPDGVDLLVNSNKPKGTPLLGTDNEHSVLKNIKKDPDNPFGSSISAAGQSEYIGDDGKKHLSAINKRAAEGDWSEWSDALPSQFLSKQSKELAKKQLKLAIAIKEEEFDEIKNLTNPTVKKKLLQDFANNCDSAAVSLKAAALPGQKYHVIIPITDLKDNECYCPRYTNGSKLALIRFPHGGTFEIPIVTVNNKKESGQKRIGKDSFDAIGINSNVAQRLSGADFDGDTVMCIPTHDSHNKIKISSKDPLPGLKDFEPKEKYPERPGMKYMTNTQKEMGVISNLITDMTLKGAKDDELAAAVRHSMVVIDAEKHHLDYKQSEIDNNIAALKKKYQIKEVDPYSGETLRYGGASTLISKAKSSERVLKRQGTPKINVQFDNDGKPNPDYDPSKPEGSLIYKTSDKAYYPSRTINKSTGMMEFTTDNGEKISYNPKDPKQYQYYNPVQRVDPNTGEIYFTNKDGRIRYKTKSNLVESTKMANTDDPYTLVSEYRAPMELLYADYASKMKAMANEARLAMYRTGNLKYNPEANKKYSEEVSSLKSKLNTVMLNKPKERQAQRAANVDIEEYKKFNTEAKAEDIKKKSQQYIEKYRKIYGAERKEIEISDKEWEAIQSGAVSENILSSIIANSNIDILRQKATPRANRELSSSKIRLIKAYANSNHTISEIASKLGISISTVEKYLKGEN